MKQYSFILLLGFIFISTETTKLEDYCWRDYEGTIPPDALRASELSNNKKPVYIGQVLYKDKIIPGKIYDKDSKIYFEYFNVEYSTVENVKILCTHKPEKFEWISTTNTEVLKLPNQFFIKGGFEPNCASYIGRTEIDGQMYPGKVICCNGVDCFGLYTTYNGTGSLHGEFQILRYNEDIVNVDIDIRNKHDKTDNGKCKQIVINLFN